MSLQATPFSIGRLLLLVPAATYVFALFCLQPCRAAEQYTLRSKRTTGAVDRVEMLLEVGGHLKVDEDTKRVKDLKMSVVGTLNYWEKTLQFAPGSRGTRQAARYYDEASAVIKVEDTGIKPQLRGDRRLIALQAKDAEATLFSPEGLLTREELDLLDVLGNSLVVDRLLPSRPVAPGATWQHDEMTMAALLGLDEVTACEVESVFDEMTERGAKMKLEGSLRGTRNGAETSLAVKAKYRFDHRLGRIAWLGLLVQEERAIGHVTPGVDAVARLQAKITPGAACPELADDRLEDKQLRPSAPLLQLTHQVSGAGWQFNCGRDWFVTRDERNTTVLQQIDGKRLIARCQVNALPQVGREDLVDLKQFQADVEEALGKHFGQFVRATQQINDRDYRVLRLVVHGKVATLPIQWVYYHVADREGHQASLAFTVEHAMLERFAQTDVAIVESLLFNEAALEPEPDPGVASASDESDAEPE